MLRTNNWLMVIGGFAVNYTPLKMLDQLNIPVRFIDINHFPQTWDLAQMGLYLANIIKVNAPQAIVAYSMGGLVVLKLLEVYSEFKGRVIMLNSSPYFMENAAWLGISPVALAQLRQRLTRLSSANFMRYVLHLFSYPYPAKDNLSHYASRVDTAALNNLLSLFDVDLRHLAIKSRQQLSWLNSDQDQIVKLNDFGQALQIVTASSHLILNGCNLLVQLRNLLANSY